MSESDERKAPGTPEAFRIERSIRSKLGVVFLSLGGLVLGIIGITYRTFATLGADNRRAEIARAQQASVFRLQLLVTGHLRGEEREEDLVREQAVYGSLRASLLAPTHEASPQEERLLHAWNDYRSSISAVLSAYAALEHSSELARREFAPWLSALSNLEAYLEPGNAAYEEQLDLLTNCRTLTSSLNSAFLKLVSAPPGDPERQARLSLAVAEETIDGMLEELLRSSQRQPAGLAGSPESVEEAQSAWSMLRDLLGQADRDKEELREIVGPSARLDLHQAFAALQKAQRVLLRRYDQRAEASRELLTRVLLASLPIVAVLVLAAMVLVRKSVVGPIRRLTDGTIRLTTGDLDARIPVEARDEVGALAHSFNVMAESLARSQRELRAWADTLEQQVQERTEELRGANEQLVRESEERERIQGELRLAQKLEAVGQLAAGIAHEINTPMQFVRDNMRFLGDVVRVAEPLLAKARSLAQMAGAGGTIDALAKELLAEMEAEDVDFLLAEGPSADAQAMEGIERVVRIVQAMKEFSHPGGEEMENVDLRRAIESTVTVATAEWKYVADVELDIAADLPEVRCLPGEINQALLNIIVNAAHAVADAEGEGGRDGERGKIRIDAEKDGDHVLIRVSDTGVGIPPEIQERVFDQFFTTKTVGRGTGQGLSIAHTVVVGKHGGTLRFESEVGRGTTFFVRLPIKRQAPAQAALAQEYARS